MKPSMTRKPAKKSRRASTRKPLRQRQNTSTMAMFPHEVADELLVSETVVYQEIARGPEKGGLRAVCLGDPNSSRPRKIVMRDDFAIFLRYKRGLLTLAQYVAELAGVGA
jgi:hypothetical protein